MGFINPFVLDPSVRHACPKLQAWHPVNLKRVSRFMESITVQRAAEMHQQKKDAERRYAHLLLDHIGVSRDLLIDHEQPDFLLVRDGHTIGIEVTELNRSESRNGQPEHVREYEQHKVIAEARSNYISMDGVPLIVSVHFNNDKVTKADRPAIALWLAKLVYEHQPRPDVTYEWDWEHAAYGSYPNCISSVAVYRLESGQEHFWTGPHSGWLNSGFEQVLKDSVEAKNGKIDKYLHCCSECWLLLIADWEQSTSSFQWFPEAKSWIPENGFARIDFFDRFSPSGKPIIQIQ